jgi:hypothetical protein
MDMAKLSTRPAGDSRQRRRSFRPGDLVLPVTGYPLLCEVVRLDAGGLLRIRGVGWSPGYTVLVQAEDYRIATGQLSQ